MVISTARRSRPFALIVAATLTAATSFAFAPDPADLRPDYAPAAYAIKGANIVVEAGRTIEGGTVVVRDGTIEAVGKADEVAIPADAEVIDGKGMSVYPGFLDLGTTLGIAGDADRSQTGAGRNVPYSDFALASTPPDNRHGLTPEFEVASALDLPDATAQERRKLGFTDLIAAPGGAISGGQSALVSLSGLPRREAVVKSPVALHVKLATPSEPPRPAAEEPPAVARRRPQGTTVRYPMALMGVVAHLRQAMLDAEYHHQVLEYHETHGGQRPPLDPALEALHRARTKALPVWWEANSRDEIHRALDLAAEFGTDAVIVGGREADKVADRLKEAGVPVILEVDFPDEPKVPGEAEYRKKEPGDRPDPLRVLKNRAAKWKERVAVAGVLAKKAVKFAFATDGLSKAETFHAQVRKAIDAGLPADAAVKALTADAAEIAGVARRFGTIARGKAGHLVVLTAPYGDARAKPRYVLADGLKFDMEKGGDAAKKKGAEGKEKGKGEPKKGEPDARQKEGADEPKPEERREVARQKAAEPNEPPRGQEDQPPSGPFVDIASELAEDRTPSLKTGGNALIKNARILTVADAGTIERGDILVRDGKIAAVGTDLTAPAGVAVIDAANMVAMPGIIDTHSHMAIAGGVNEMSLSIVPEVRVADVVDGEDPTIYRALAGGTTTARLLHGSANTIGGQDVVIKLRHGEAGRDLILKDDRRPQGVKFALGENVTRRTNRFPNTRMGVEAVIERAFDEARAYRQKQQAHGRAPSDGQPAPPFRRDLRLEALARILDGSIKIHCHCYRSDEILMLLRVAERHGVRVQSLQHVLEGYKVAAEIAAHGASASTFSDWWAYKVEAYDAIPFNAALLTEAGVQVCIKSDSEELVRHLYLEAAKMVKYGGVPERTALEMITLNPARELGLDHRLGSIEPGKDADIALFNAHPFDSFARCELALVDGEVRFQRKNDGGGFAPRPGDHAMPSATGKELEIEVDPSRPYALVGATVHPISGPRIERGVVVVRDGKVAAVGGPETSLPTGTQTVDAAGLHVWPGMVDAGSLLGLFEIGSLSETQDFRDSAQFQPELRTSTAIHPDSEVIPVTRANGILSAFIQPTGGTIAGQGCIAALDGWVPSEMVLADRVALVVNIPTYFPPNPDGGRSRFAGGDPNQRRQERLDAIREQFRAALAYDQVVAAANEGKVAAPVPDPRLAALAPYARGRQPVIFQAERQVEILDALELAEDLKLRAIISGGLEAWKVADALKAAEVPVIVAGTLRLPGSPTDPYDAAYANPARLHAAGVPFAIRSHGQGADQATAGRNLPYEAATAVAYGLPDDEGLKAVTLYPAQILGVADRLGSIEPGKRADLVVTDGHLLRATTVVKALVVGGDPLPPTSRHTRLFDKYRGRLQQVRAGKAPLGLDRPAASPTAPEGPTPAVGAPAAPADRR